MKGRWAAGIEPRNFAWILKDQLAVSERPGGFAPHHRRVRRQEEILWLTAHGFTRIVSLLPSNHNLHAYGELHLPAAHYALPAHGDVRPVLGDLYGALWAWLHGGERVLLHQDELGEQLAGVVAGFLCWSGLLPEPPRAVSAVEQLLRRQMGHAGRSLVAAAAEMPPGPAGRRPPTPAPAPASVAPSPEPAPSHEAEAEPEAAAASPVPPAGRAATTAAATEAAPTSTVAAKATRPKAAPAPAAKATPAPAKATPAKATAAKATAAKATPAPPAKATAAKATPAPAAKATRAAKTAAPDRTAPAPTAKKPQAPARTTQQVPAKAAAGANGTAAAKAAAAKAAGAGGKERASAKAAKSAGAVPAATPAAGHRGKRS